MTDTRSQQPQRWGRCPPRQDDADAKVGDAEASGEVDPSHARDLGVRGPPVGSQRPIHLDAASTRGPSDAVRAAQLLGAGTNIAVHWGTFELGDDGEHEAADSLRQALAQAHPAIRRFWALENGRARDIPL